MGDAKSGPVRLSFNPQLRVAFRGTTEPSDARLLLPRELDGRPGNPGGSVSEGGAQGWDIEGGDASNFERHPRIYSTWG